MSHLLWIDLEMTGLDEKKHFILEIACVITDLDFHIKESFHTPIYQPESILATMDSWCQKTHHTSGLLDRISQGIGIEVAEKEILKLVQNYFSPSEKIILVGNSVGNDKRFIEQFMPLFSQRLHYRIIDVSSFKEIFQKKYRLFYKKKNTHRALDDITESIQELSFYLGSLSVQPSLDYEST